MKTKLYFFIFLFSSLFINAQSSSFFPFGGYHFSGTTEILNESASFNSGYSAGLGYRFRVGQIDNSKLHYAISIEPHFNSIDIDIQNEVLNITEVKVPLMFNLVNGLDTYDLSFFKSLAVGGYGSSLLSAKLDGSDVSDSIKDFDYGLAANLEFQIIFIRLRLQYFHSLASEGDINEVSIRSNYFSAGILFPF